MRVDRLRRGRLGARRDSAAIIAGAVVGLLMCTGALAGLAVRADPADDALAKLNELSRQAEQTTEAMYSARVDFHGKIVVLLAAEQTHGEAKAVLDATRGQLAAFRSAVNEFAAATYMGGRSEGTDAILTASSPQQLIDKLAVQRVINGDLSLRMDRYRSADQRAQAAEEATAKAAADARNAAEEASAVRADLEAKHSQLQMRIAAVKSQYFALTPGQRQTLAVPGTSAQFVPPAPMPEGLPPIPPGAPEAAPGAPQFPPAVVDVAHIAPAGNAAATAVQAALTQVGSSYVWGGAAPGGFDCSGLVMWAYSQAGIALPHSSQAQGSGGQPVSLSELQPGDVLTFYSDASHSGIYLGDGMMVHSPTFGQTVEVAPTMASGPIYNARRY